jgi:hypothetical protein
VGISAGNNTGAAGATGAGRKIGIIKTDTFLRHAINIGRLHFSIAVTAQVIPTDIISNKNNDVGRGILGPGILKK